MPIRIVSTAARAIAEAADWWRINREKAPDAFAQELNRALLLIATQPNMGSRARNAALNGVRRIHLARIRYDLYYRVVAGHEATIEVLAFWHASRQTAASLKNSNRGL